MVEEESLSVASHGILIHQNLYGIEPKPGRKEHLWSAEFEFICCSGFDRGRHQCSVRRQVKQLSPVAPPVWEHAAPVRYLPLAISGWKIPDVYFIAPRFNGGVGNPTRRLSPVRRKARVKFREGMLQERKRFLRLARTHDRPCPGIHVT